MDEQHNIICTISIYLQTQYIQSYYLPKVVQHYLYTQSTLFTGYAWQYVQSKLVNSIYSFSLNLWLYNTISTTLSAYSLTVASVPAPPVIVVHCITTHTVCLSANKICTELLYLCYRAYWLHNNTTLFFFFNFTSDQ